MKVSGKDNGLAENQNYQDSIINTMHDKTDLEKFKRLVKEIYKQP